MANGRGDDFTPLVRLMRTVNSIHYPTRFAQVFFSKNQKNFPRVSPPDFAFGKEGGQACRSRPRKIPRKSRGVYLTFTPLPAPRRRGLVRRADERGVSPPVSPEPEGYPGGTASPLEVRDTGVSSRSSRSRPVPASECPSESGHTCRTAPFPDGLRSRCRRPRGPPEIPWA